MSATSVPSRLGSLFNRNGNGHSTTHGLPARLEEPEATTTERAIVGAVSGASQPAQISVVEPDQIVKASRRRYSREEKLRILRLAEACKERGQLGALLRREGIYFSTLRQFQQQLECGRLEAGYARDHQAARAELAADKKRIAELETQNRQLMRKLEQAELIIDVQKKLSQLLGVTLPTMQESHQTLD